MRVHYFRYECGSCGHHYKSPRLGGGYGEGLMYNENNIKPDIVYLDAIGDKVFKEFSNILRAHSKIKQLDDSDRATVLHNLFGVACDKSSDNTEYKLGRMPACPACGKLNILHWGPTDNPPEYGDIEAKPVTHHAWNALSQEQKNELVDRTLTHYLQRPEIAYLQKILEGDLSYIDVVGLGNKGSYEHSICMYPYHVRNILNGYLNGTYSVADLKRWVHFIWTHSEYGSPAVIKNTDNREYYGEMYDVIRYLHVKEPEEINKKCVKEYLSILDKYVGE